MYCIHKPIVWNNVTALKAPINKIYNLNCIVFIQMFGQIYLEFSRSLTFFKHLRISEISGKSKNI